MLAAVVTPHPPPAVYSDAVPTPLSQNVIPAEVSLVCVVKPDEFWDKKVTHFCFWKEKDRLGFEVSRPFLRSCLLTADDWVSSNEVPL